MDGQLELFCYETMPVWHSDDIPDVLREGHRFNEGEWCGLTVVKGRLKYMETDGAGGTSVAELAAGSAEQMIPPQHQFAVEPLTGDTEIKLSLYCTAGLYFHKKYGMSATHSAVLAAEDTVPAGKALDMGCGQGRNALFLGLKGFEVTAVDNNPQAVQNVDELARMEGLNIRAFEYDLNAANLQENFDYIVATVVFMFLYPRFVPQVIADMQAHTNSGGYNLIVCAMDTEDFPCPMPFPFTFKEGELRGYYQDWQIVEYNEELGSMHAKDAAGNPIRFKFATMLAKKPEAAQ